MALQPEDPDIRLVEEENGELTLAIDGGQAMQAWERELMNESADILCTYGSQFLEVGLGLGISALRIASNPNTTRHTVLEKYPRVIELFHQQHPDIPDTLNIVQADFVQHVHLLEPESFDGIFFDPALTESMWNTGALWDTVVPPLVRALRPGGAFIPFFTTKPYLRWQYVDHFDRVDVEIRSFKAYDTTRYTATTEGRAYIQCYIRSRDP